MDCGLDGSTGGVRCPLCFVRRAWDKGLTDVNWELVPIPKGFGARMPLEGRVVPTYHYYTGEPRELMRQWYASFIGTDGHWHQWDQAQAEWRETRDSALFAESPVSGDGVTLSSVLLLDLQSLKASGVRVVSRVFFFIDRPVVLRHFISSDGLLSRTLHRLNHWRSGVE